MLKTNSNLSLYVLMFTLILSAVYLKWVYEPLSYEKFVVLEREAHENWGEHRLDEAYDKFIEVIGSAKKDKNRLVSLYVFAGRVALDNNKYEFAVENFLSAIRLDSKDKGLSEYLKTSLSGTAEKLVFEEIKRLPKNLINKIFNDGNELYISYYSDGWARGKTSSMLAFCEQVSCNREIEFFALGLPDNQVQIFNEDELIYNEKIKPHEKKSVMVKVKNGLSIVTFISDGLATLEGKDKRTVGLNYKVKN